MKNQPNTFDIFNIFKNEGDARIFDIFDIFKSGTFPVRGLSTSNLLHNYIFSIMLSRFKFQSP